MPQIQPSEAPSPVAVPAPHVLSNWLLGIAVALPLIWPFDPGIVAKMGTTLVACALWGAVLLVTAVQGLTPRFGLAALAFGVLAGVVALQSAAGQLAYVSQGLATVAILIAAALVAGLGNAAARRASAGDPAARGWLDAVAAGLLAQGLIQVALGLFQFSLWQLPAVDQWFSAHLPLYSQIVSFPSTGRVFGNLRQPNHYATAVALGLAGLAWWAPRMRTALVWIAAVAMSWALVVCGSRTGMVQAVVAAVLVLAAVRGAWRHPRWSALAAVPLLYAAWWLALRLAADAGWIGFLDAVTRQIDQPVNARALIWRNAWQVFEHLPWFGAGWGQLGWGLQHAALHAALHPLPLDNIDNAHDLLLQLLAETGLTGTVPVLAVALIWLWRAWRRWAALGRADTNARSPLPLAAWMGVAFLGLHSLVEYPLWYLYFLWPFAFLAGWMDGAGTPAASAATAGRAELPRPAAAALAALALLLVAKAGFDYAATNGVYDGDSAQAGAPRAMYGNWFFRPLAEFARASSLRITAADPRAVLLRDRNIVDRVSHAYGDPHLLMRRIVLLSRLGHPVEALRLARYTASAFWLYAPGLTQQFPLLAAQAGLTPAQAAPLVAALRNAPVLRRIVVPTHE